MRIVQVLVCQHVSGRPSTVLWSAMINPHQRFRCAVIDGVFDSAAASSHATPSACLRGRPLTRQFRGKREWPIRQFLRSLQQALTGRPTLPLLTRVPRPIPYEYGQLLAGAESQPCANAGDRNTAEQSVPPAGAPAALLELPARSARTEIVATHTVRIADRLAAHDFRHRAVGDLLAALLKP
jgi:hypothetical protein